MSMASDEELEHAAGESPVAIRGRKKSAKKKRCKYLDEDAEMSGDERQHDEEGGEDDDEDEAGSLKDFINDEPSSSEDASSSSDDEAADKKKSKKKSKKKKKKLEKEKKKSSKKKGEKKEKKVKSKKEKKSRSKKPADGDEGDDRRSDNDPMDVDDAQEHRGDGDGEASGGGLAMSADQLENAEWRPAGVQRRVRVAARDGDGDGGGGDDGGADAERERLEQEKMVQSILKMQLYNDPDNCNNLSRNIRVVPHINDVQVHPDYDGYVYCFTSPAEGPTLSRMAWLQIMALLHVLNSPISGACVIETDHLKPVFGTHGLMEKLSKRIPLNDEESSADRRTRREINAQPICDMPFDVPFVAAGLGGNGAAIHSDDEEDDGFGAGPAAERCVWQVTNIADILVGMACVDYVVPSSSSSSNAKQKKNRRGDRGDGRDNQDIMSEDEEEGEDENEEDEEEHDDEDERTAAFWVVMLKTRKCYSFVDHLHTFVTQGEKEAATNLLGKRPNKEYDDVLAMIREVIMYQHEMSPNATAYFRRPGMTNAVDPLQAIMDKCMPPSLEHTCSIYEAFRSMTWHVKNEGEI